MPEPTPPDEGRHQYIKEPINLKLMLSRSNLCSGLARHVRFRAAARDGRFVRVAARMCSPKPRPPTAGSCCSTARRLDQWKDLQRRFAHAAVARRGRLHSGQRRRQRPFGLHRHQETVRKLHPRLGLETLLRRQQRHALPRRSRILISRFPTSRVPSTN